MSARFNAADYIDVDTRIDQFWERYPNGAIRTEMLYCNNDGSSVAIKASVYKDWEHPAPDATGIAQEYQGGKGANATSWWENCETSAIGRALANMGMASSTKRPSRQEMQKVERHSDPAPARSAPARAERPQDARNEPGEGATPTLTPREFDRVIEGCWTLVEDGAVLDAVKASLNHARPRMSEEQRIVARQQLTAIETAIKERDTLTPAG